MSVVDLRVLLRGGHLGVIFSSGESSRLCVRKSLDSTRDVNIIFVTKLSV